MGIFDKVEDKEPEEVIDESKEEVETEEKELLVKPDDYDTVDKLVRG